MRFSLLFLTLKIVEAKQDSIEIAVASTPREGQQSQQPDQPQQPQRQSKKRILERIASVPDLNFGKFPEIEIAQAAKRKAVDLETAVESKPKVVLKIADKGKEPIKPAQVFF